MLIFLLLIAGGVFWWWSQPRSLLRRWWIEKIEMGGSVGDFSIKDTLGETVVENKREGLKVKVPKGWGVEKEKPEAVFWSTWGVHLSSPDLIVKAYGPPDLYLLEKGCLIDVRIEKNELQHNRVNRYIESVSKAGEEPLTLEEERFKVIEIDERQALEEFVYDGDKGRRVEVRTLLEDDKNIYFVFCSSPRDTERCSQIFDEFLKTVSIE